MTEEERRKAILAGCSLAMWTTSTAIEERLSSLSEDELREEFAAQTAIIEAEDSTFASVISAAMWRWRVHTEFSLRQLSIE